MGLLSKFWKRTGQDLPKYTLRLSVRGPTGQTRHQFVTFEAGSLGAAVEHARRRADHQHVLRWKLFDANNKEVASSMSINVRAVSPGDGAKNRSTQPIRA